MSGTRAAGVEYVVLPGMGIKEKQGLIQRIKTTLGKLYKKLAQSREILNKDGEVRRNRGREQLKSAMGEQEAELERVQEAKRHLPKRIEVSSLQDYQSFKRIDNEGKNLFDFVTCSVWNVRKQMVDWLQPDFNQKNETVDLFYAITSRHGLDQEHRARSDGAFGTAPTGQAKNRSRTTMS
jgi:hypothetical protein